MRWENDQVCGVTESWSSARDNSVTSGRDVDRVRGCLLVSHADTEEGTKKKKESPLCRH